MSMDGRNELFFSPNGSYTDGESVGSFTELPLPFLQAASVRKDFSDWSTNYVRPKKIDNSRVRDIHWTNVSI